MPSTQTDCCGTASPFDNEPFDNEFFERLLVDMRSGNTAEQPPLPDGWIELTTEADDRSWNGLTDEETFIRPTEPTPMALDPTTKNAQQATATSNRAAPQALGQEPVKEPAREPVPAAESGVSEPANKQSEAQGKKKAASKTAPDETIPGKKIIRGSEDYCLLYKPYNEDKTLPAGNKLLDEVTAEKIKNNLNVNAGDVLSDDRLKNMKYCVKLKDGLKNKFGDGSSWHNDTLTVVQFRSDRARLNRWFKPYLEKKKEIAHGSDSRKKRKADEQPNGAAGSIPISSGVPVSLEAHTKAKSVLMKSMTLEDFGQNFEYIRVSLENLEAAQLGRVRDDWAMFWAKCRSSTDQAEKLWADALNNDRRTVLWFLYFLCNMCTEGEFSPQQLVDKFDHVIFRILSVCLVMDKYHALFGLTDSKKNTLGKEWYAEDHTPLMKEIGAISEDGGHPMNKRFLWLSKWSEKFPKLKLPQEYSDWITPTLCPVIDYSDDVKAAARAKGVAILDER